MAFMPQINYKTKTLTKGLGDGINTSVPAFDIADTELSYVRNLSSKNYPAASVRPGKQLAFAQITTPNALGQRNNELPHVQDGTVWKRWDGTQWVNIQTGLTNSTGKIVEFATGTTRYTILVNGTDKYAWDGNTVINLTNAPASKLIAVHKGRCYIAQDNDIKFCNINLLNDWTTVNAAGLIDVTEARGSLSAIVEYADHIIVWTKSSMHELYGTGPFNYKLVTISLQDGCISDRSINECNGNLYWLDYCTVKMYTGNIPAVVSDKVKTYLEGINLNYMAKCVSGVHNDSYFLSIVYGDATDNNLILELDTRKGKWFVHTGNIVNFVTIGENLYGVDSTGKLWNMDSGTTDNGTAIQWEAVTKAFNFGAIRELKELDEINVVIDLPAGSTLSMYYSTTYDQDDFTLLKTFTANTNVQNINILVPLMVPADWFRFKLVGTGPCTLHYIEYNLRIIPR